MPSGFHSDAQDRADNFVRRLNRDGELAKPRREADRYTNERLATHRMIDTLKRRAPRREDERRRGAGRLPERP